MIFHTFILYVLIDTLVLSLFVKGDISPFLDKRYQVVFRFQNPKPSSNYSLSLFFIYQVSIWAAQSWCPDLLSPQYFYCIFLCMCACKTYYRIYFSTHALFASLKLVELMSCNIYHISVDLQFSNRNKP